MSVSLRPHGLYSPWNSPGQNTGVGSLSLLQGIFPTQRLNPGLLHCRQILFFFFQADSLPVKPQGKPSRSLWPTTNWHLPSTLTRSGASLVAQTVKNLKHGRPKFDPTPVFFCGGFHVQRSLVGYSP